MASLASVNGARISCCTFICCSYCVSIKTFAVSIYIPLGRFNPVTGNVLKWFVKMCPTVDMDIINILLCFIKLHEQPMNGLNTRHASLSRYPVCEQPKHKQHVSPIWYALTLLAPVIALLAHNLFLSSIKCTLWWRDSELNILITFLGSQNVPSQ